MKKVYLVHGWEGSSTSQEWFNWLKEELKEKNIKFEALEMPDTNHPRIETWVKHLENNVKELDEETYFIGHSIGCQAILRFLEKLPENIKIKGCVFVAGWFDLKEEAYEGEEDKEIAKPWIETPINLEKVKEHTNNFLAIFSNDDSCVPLSGSKIFKEKLNSKIIIKKNQGHFDEVDGVPEILDFLLK
jgi:predicted alpha/beta hydrolase family esterase